MFHVCLVFICCVFFFLFGYVSRCCFYFVFLCFLFCYLLCILLLSYLVSFLFVAFCFVSASSSDEKQNINDPKHDNCLNREVGDCFRICLIKGMFQGDAVYQTAGPKFFKT